MSKLTDRLPSIPDYYRQYVDPTVDLNVTPSRPCPFHNEKSGKSFTYSSQLNRWRCWGQCHRGGDVIALHQINFRFKTREEAKQDLYKKLNIPISELLTFELEKHEVDPKEVYRRRVYSLAVKLATEPNDWLELDYILSKVPYDVKELEVFCAKLGHPISFKDSLPS